MARNNPQVYNPTWWEGVGIETFAYDELGVGPVGLAKDLFGDGSVLLVSTPGHSAGHCSVLVRSSGKSVLLAGDCCYSAKNWKEDILPGHMVDSENALKSLKWLKDSAGADKDLSPSAITSLIWISLCLNSERTDFLQERGGHMCGRSLSSDSLMAVSPHDCLKL